MLEYCLTIKKGNIKTKAPMATIANLFPSHPNHEFSHPNTEYPYEALWSLPSILRKLDSRWLYCSQQTTNNGTANKTTAHNREYIAERTLFGYNRNNAKPTMPNSLMYDDATMHNVAQRYFLFSNNPKQSIVNPAIRALD
jgi:hypothetical protein